MNLLFIILLSIFWTYCSKDENNPHENGQQDNSNSILKQKLIGSWLEYAPCDSCYILTFETNDTIVQLNTSNDKKVYYTYEILSDDSIRVTRLWEILPDIKTTEHKINFIHNDTIELVQFFAVSYGITGFEDVKLYKTE